MTEPRTNLSPLGSSGPEAMADPTPGKNDVLGNSKPRSVWNDAWDSLERNPLFWISVALIVVFLVMAAVPAIFTSKDPTDCNLSAARHIPSAVHWFGTDIQGCDVYSRTVYGARSSILVGVLATLGTTILGAFIGLVAGFRGGWLDTLLSRTGDVFYAIPLLLGGIIILYTFPNPVSRHGAQSGRCDHHPRLAVHRTTYEVVGASGTTTRLRSGRSRARGVVVANHPLAHPAQCRRPGNRSGHHQSRCLHCHRGDTELSGHRPAGTSHLVGCVDF